jgi:hypothetical protein
MKTTLNLNDALLAEAKIAAVRQGSSLTRLIEEGLRLRLRGGPQDAAAPAPVRLPVFCGQGGLREGLTPGSNRSMWEALDDDA